MLGIKELSWASARKKIVAVNKELATIIDDLSPDESLSLIEATYPYGVNIIDQGKLCIPTEQGRVITLDHHEVPKRLREKLLYRSIPLTISLEHDCEVFIKDNDRIIPVRLINPGQLFGVFEALDRKNFETSSIVTNVASGGRSIFMLPPITDSYCHKRLMKHFGLRLHRPRHLLEQQPVFSAIVNRIKTDKPWVCRVLFFSGQWLEHENDTTWMRFNNYLYRLGWYQSEFWRKQTTFSVLWKNLTETIQKSNVKIMPHILDILKQLVFLSLGAVPGFRPTGQEENTCPTKFIQNAYIDLYGLKNYFPTIMQPYQFMTSSHSAPVYYSLATPTLMRNVSKPKREPTLMEEARELKTLTDILQTHILEWGSQHQYIQNILFHYYHSDKDITGMIEPSRNIKKSDNQFISNIWASNQKFAENSSFFKGCVKISTIESP